MSLVQALTCCGLVSGERFSVAAIKGREIRPACFDSPSEATTWLEPMGDFNHYFCGNPVRSGIQGKPRAADILQGRVLLLDADPDPDETACREAILKVRTWLQERCIDCTAVYSGRGCQLWIRTDPSLTDAMRIRHGTGLAKIGATPGVKFDATFNVDRLMRLPSSINHRTGRVACFL
jgi:hypothetical protein